MGLFNKLKNILFEDEEVEEMPVYTKKSEEEKVLPRVSSKPQVEEREERKKDIETVKPVENTRFRGIKRDIDVAYDDVFDEVPGGESVVQQRVEEKIDMPKEVEKKSPFLSFDEEEFERLNSRIVHNENKSRVQTNKSEVMDNARRANGNFSATTTVRDTSRTNPDKYKIDNTNAKKPFKPSPVISPVYGILGENYKKDDIVDKKDGMKREIFRPVVHMTEPIVHEDLKQEKIAEVKKINVDSVRNKAYGSCDEFEEKDDVVTIEDIQEVDLPEKKDEFVKSDDNIEFEVSNENDLDEIVANHFDEIEDENDDVHKVEDFEDNNNDVRVMDEMERTSTLQILDDIEKELNAIKPISKSGDSSLEDDDTNNDDTLENDLFNLIDSMYEDGEEEDDA